MSKEEARNLKRGAGSAAGNAKKEVTELERMQEAGRGVDSGITTITVGCSNLWTLICC